MSSESMIRAFMPTDAALECTCCGEKRLVAMWLRVKEWDWDPLCQRCTLQVVVWATAAGVQDAGRERVR
jgi:hypothetical protein